MAPNMNEDWRPIAEQVSNEMNPVKLMALVAQLCCALDGNYGTARPPKTARPGRWLGFLRESVSGIAD
jgi:hypothetical protein